MTITAVNVRNQFKGVIQEVLEGDVVSEINVETKAGLFTSIISTRSVKDLDLKVGSEVVVLIKSTEVSLAKL
ncbi:TOBE domain-containing protein [Acinetobacter sp. ANC 5380]|jgi:molybdopterin-binding protein|uniref:TOBE domain-containing protein n=1 Tax=Acinetobacter terrae TaxID=2731247 RepID=A0A2C9WSR1_9GAMM|nr:MULTISPECIES: TOBE domain-containing protein [Acinetobacter]MDD2941200.1 TOBE domain-containing protein [Acinetobacter harbinensis]NNG75373.1 TOBE domain-containing protein [Acinetobacter terrae]NNH00767.1 TOBE domain-containing protein [Acinetobacter sp. ANC 5414]NNH16583.1 TOBE domain-containing protein [Acinetobacter terrae]NNH38875.1 TOBE domain-containing protein [Acinetobacter terrae]